LSGFALAGLIAGLGRNVSIGNPFDIILTGLGGFILLQVAALFVLIKPDLSLNYLKKMPAILIGRRS
jgi:hypothetical protein